MLSHTFFAHWLFNMPLTREEEIDLAEEVRKFPALYDKKNSQYHERKSCKIVGEKLLLLSDLRAGILQKDVLII